jgi:hypothetical protein
LYFCTTYTHWTRLSLTQPHQYGPVAGCFEHGNKSAGPDYPKTFAHATGHGSTTLFCPSDSVRK